MTKRSTLYEVDYPANPRGKASKIVLAPAGSHLLEGRHQWSCRGQGTKFDLH